MRNKTREKEKVGRKKETSKKNQLTADRQPRWNRAVLVANLPNGRIGGNWSQKKENFKITKNLLARTKTRGDSKGC